LIFFRDSLETGTGNCFHLIKELPIAIREFPDAAGKGRNAKADFAGLARKRTRSPRLVANATQGNAEPRRLNERWMRLETEPVRESRQIVENPDNVGDLQAPHLVKAKRAQHLPVRDRHARRMGAKFLGDRA
jgi:hypothetical protein